MKKILVLSLLWGHLALADDGVFAINNVCVNFGCFTGDTAGYPITISEPGSYILTSNLNSTLTDTNVIEITANNVTLDLNGFAIIGPKSCTGEDQTLTCNNSAMTAHGVRTDSGSSSGNVTVKNGFVKGFSTGISLFADDGRSHYVERVHVSENSTGISTTGVVSDSIASRNGNGILASGFQTLFIKDSQTRGNRAVNLLGSACSNVHSTGDGTNACGLYTNESTCNGSGC